MHESGQHDTLFYTNKPQYGPGDWLICHHRQLARVGTSAQQTINNQLMGFASSSVVSLQNGLTSEPTNGGNRINS